MKANLHIVAELMSITKCSSNLKYIVVQDYMA